MMNPTQYTQDVFLSYSPEDKDWVDTWLLPHLKEAGIDVISYDDLTIGATKVDNITNAVKDSTAGGAGGRAYGVAFMLVRTDRPPVVLLAGHR